MRSGERGEEAERLARFASDGPPEHGLPAIKRLRRLLDEWEAMQVAAARDRGWAWGEIARVLGRSRQAVHARYRGNQDGRGERSTKVVPPPPTPYEIEEQRRRLFEQYLTGEVTVEEWQRGSQLPCEP